MSIRQTIINAVDTRLKTITVANGYATNIGNKVFAWREEPLADTDLPGLIYRDTKNTVREETYGLFIWSLTIEIEIYAVSLTAPADLRNMIEDVYKLIQSDPTWAQSAIEDTGPPAGDEIKIAHDDKLRGVISISFEILYTANRWNM